MSYDILLFDADNTLFDFSAAERECFFELAPLYNIPQTENAYEAYRDFNLESWKDIEKGVADKHFLLLRRYVKLFDYLGIDGDAEKLNDDFLNKLAEKSIVYPYTPALLKNLAACGKRIFMITNGVASVQHGRLDRSEIKNSFEKVFISEEAGASKPHKDYFEFVAKHIEGFDKKKAIVIGDSLTGDIAGANGYGLDCIWFNPENLPMPAKYKANFIAKTLQEVENYLIGK